MDAPLVNIVVALGVGLLIGIERERTNRERGTLGSAGLRTFSIAALVGAVAVSAGGPILLAVALVMITALAGVSYWRTLNEDGPGLTTEFALQLTVLAGGLAMEAPGVAGAVAIIVALLLSGRERLHHFAASVLTDEEVRSALILAAAVAVILPLLPDVQMGPYDALNPRSMWRLVVLVLLIGAVGHVATRLLGPRFGLPISGLASGFVSSSATIGAMGSRAAKAPEVMTSAAAGAVLSTVATVIQMAAVIGAVSPAVLNAMSTPLIGAGVMAVAYGAVFSIAALRQKTEGGHDVEGAFKLSSAIVFALTLSVVLLVSAALRAQFGESGVIAAGALAGFADSHAPAISIASLAANGQMTPAECVIPILVGFSTNSLTKIVLAWTSGGPAFALRVVPGVILVAIGAWGGALIGPVIA